VALCLVCRISCSDVRHSPAAQRAPANALRPARVRGYRRSRSSSEDWLEHRLQRASLVSTALGRLSQGEMFSMSYDARVEQHGSDIGPFARTRWNSSSDASSLFRGQQYHKRITGQYKRTTQYAHSATTLHSAAFRQATVTSMLLTASTILPITGMRTGDRTRSRWWQASLTRASLLT